MKSIVLLAAFAAFAGVGVSRADNAVANGHYLATAYDQHGLTASGIPVQRHVVAADPNYLPLGSIIKIRGAGRYSGEYVVADTGESVVGRHLDIYIPNERACRKFGRKTVRVKLVSLGHDTKSNVKDAVHSVKQDVKQEVQKNAVGDAATEADWAAHHAEQKKQDSASPQPASK